MFRGKPKPIIHHRCAEDAGTILSASEEIVKALKKAINGRKAELTDQGKSAKFIGALNAHGNCVDLTLIECNTLTCFKINKSAPYTSAQCHEKLIRDTKKYINVEVEFIFKDGLFHLRHPKLIYGALPAVVALFRFLQDTLFGSWRDQELKMRQLLFNGSSFAAALAEQGVSFECNERLSEPRYRANKIKLEPYAEEQQYKVLGAMLARCTDPIETEFSMRLISAAFEFARAALQDRTMADIVEPTAMLDKAFKLEFIEPVRPSKKDTRHGKESLLGNTFYKLAKFSAENPGVSTACINWALEYEESHFKPDKLNSECFIKRASTTVTYNDDSPLDIWCGTTRQTVTFPAILTAAEANALKNKLAFLDAPKDPQKALSFSKNLGNQADIRRHKDDKKRRSK